MRKYDLRQIAAAATLLTKPAAKPVTVRRELRLGLIGHNYVSESDRSRIVEGLLREMPALVRNRENDFVSIFSPLAPGADLMMTQLVTAWLTERRLSHRLVVVRTVPQEVVLKAFLPHLARGGSWCAPDSTPPASTTDAALQIDRTIDALVAANPANIVANLLPPGLTLHDWYADPELCQAGYRHANAYIVSRCDAVVAFYDAHRDRPGGPAAGGTAEALAWARNVSQIPEEYGGPPGDMKSPAIVIVPSTEAAGVGSAHS
jgi:hypothetical protein